MSEESIEKTAFCLGPGFGLWEFTVMPYGLTGATQTCQWGGMDEVLKECKDCVVIMWMTVLFSDMLDFYITDLRGVLS